MMSVIERIREIQVLAREGRTPNLMAAFEPLRKGVVEGDLTLDERQAFWLVDILAVSGMPDEAAELAESLRRQGRDWSFLDRTLAHALIERSQFGAARLILEHLELRGKLTPFEAASCQAHLGRLFKSLGDTAEQKRLGAANAAREEAIRRYRRALTLSQGGDPGETEDDRKIGRQIYRVWRWGGTNLLTLMLQESATLPELQSVAKEIIEQITARPAMDYFDHSALGSAHFAVGDIPAGVEQYHRMMDQPEVNLGQIERVLRDFNGHRSELVKTHEAVAELKRALEAVRLHRLKGVVVVSMEERAYLLKKLQRLSPGDDAELSPHVFALRWLADGLRQAGPIARIGRKDGSVGGGTGFLVSGENIGLAADVALLVTCAHVLSTKGEGDSIATNEAVVTFDWSNSAKYNVKKVVFESPRDEQYRLDATIAVLEGDGDLGKIGKLAVGSGDAVRTAARTMKIAGGYTIGHPLGHELSVTLGPARFTGEFTDYHSHRDARFLHYTTETMNGNSGGPIFDKDWKVVALHQNLLMHLSAQPGQGLVLTTLFDIARGHINA